MDKLQIKLPIWMNKGEPAKLAAAAQKYWQKLAEWVRFPLMQFDPLTCHESILYLLAYQRDINRFIGEPLSLFRLRVKHAFINAQQAGELAGFAAIFRRLGIGEITQLERQSDYDWDVIVIRVTDNQIAENNDLMMALIRQYGRTCRRYVFQIINDKSLHLMGGEFDHHQEFYTASIDVLPGVIHFKQSVKAPIFNHDTTIFTAKI